MKELKVNSINDSNALIQSQLKCASTRLHNDSQQRKKVVLCAMKREKQG